MASLIHYEVFIRKTPPAPWALAVATENRQKAMDTATDMLGEKRACAVKVVKETLNEATGEYASLTILTKGEVETKTKAKKKESDGPICRGVQDLYTHHAREKIGRVLEDWLGRRAVTPFELLHRPDLAEQLEASGVELQHAVQKIAVPESQGTDMNVHDLVRHYQKLCEQAIDRVMQSGRKKLFPSVEKQSISEIARSLMDKAERAFLMGGTVSCSLIGIRSSRARLDKLMDLVDGAPDQGPERALILLPIEQILCELLASRTYLAQILGPSLDQGASLAAVVRMVAPNEINMLTQHDPKLALMIPPVDGAPARLGARLAAGDFPHLSQALARMVLRELMSQRRLRPDDAYGEIEILRALAAGLTATTGRLLSAEAVQNAFIERSKNLVIADFVSLYTKNCTGLQDEAERLAWLCENVTGAANKRAAGRWLQACVTSLRFETEMRGEIRPVQGAAPGEARKPVSPSQRLAILARLQRTVRNASLSEHDTRTVIEALGTVGGVVEADVKLVTQIGRAPAPLHQKLMALLRLAAGESGPSGPVADRAKTEAMRLFRLPEARTDLGRSPEVVQALRPLMQAAGLAA
jgi:hypothetical protein